LAGLLTRQDGGEGRVTVGLGPLSAWPTEDQALVARLAVDVADQGLLAADGLDRHGMIRVDDFPAVALDDMCQTFDSRIHHTLVI
jgi:hypothetical protein